MKLNYEKIPYLFFSLTTFLILPVFYYLFNNKSEVLIYMLLIIFPIISFLISYLYAYKLEDFSYTFSIIIGVFFLISCIIFWNFEIYVYIIIYIISSLCGQGTGFTIKKIVRKIKK